MAKYNLVQVVFDRSLLAPDEDVAITTFHIREVIQGAPDIVDVTDQGRQNFVNDLSSWWTGLRSVIVTQVHFLEARFYEIPDQAGADMGDPVLVQPFNAPGTSPSSPMPPQVALSVTFKTDTRKRWGRSYLPGVGISHNDAVGRIDATTRQTVADAYKSLTDRSGTGAAAVVWSPTFRNHQDINEIQVDDVWDVIRRRRYSHPLARTIIDASD